MIQPSFEHIGRVGAPPAATADSALTVLDTGLLSGHIRPTGWCVLPTSHGPTDRLKGTHGQRRAESEPHSPGTHHQYECVEPPRSAAPLLSSTTRFRSASPSTAPAAKSHIFDVRPAPCSSRNRAVGTSRRRRNSQRHPRANRMSKLHPASRTAIPRHDSACCSTSRSWIRQAGQVAPPHRGDCAPPPLLRTIKVV